MEKRKKRIKILIAAVIVIAICGIIAHNRAEYKKNVLRCFNYEGIARVEIEKTQTFEDGETVNKTVYKRELSDDEYSALVGVLSDTTIRKYSSYAYAPRDNFIYYIRGYNSNDKLVFGARIFDGRCFFMDCTPGIEEPKNIRFTVKRPGWGNILELVTAYESDG